MATFYEYVVFTFKVIVVHLENRPKGQDIQVKIWQFCSKKYKIFYTLNITLVSRPNEEANQVKKVTTRSGSTSWDVWKSAKLKLTIYLKMEICVKCTYFEVFKSLKKIQNIFSKFPK